MRTAGHTRGFVFSKFVQKKVVVCCCAYCRVPAEYVQQAPDAANPPTFFLLLSDMSQRVAAAAKV